MNAADATVPRWAELPLMSDPAKKGHTVKKSKLPQGFPMYLSWRQEKYMNKQGMKGNCNPDIS
jgi:hypothetical protein